MAVEIARTSRELLIPEAPQLKDILLPDAFERLRIPEDPNITYFGEFVPGDVGYDIDESLALEIMRIQNHKESTQNLTGRIDDLNKMRSRIYDPAYHVLVGKGQDKRLLFAAVLQDKPDNIHFSEAFLGVVNPEVRAQGIGAEAMIHMLNRSLIEHTSMEGKKDKHRFGIKLTTNVPPQDIPADFWDLFLNNQHREAVAKINTPMLNLARKVGFTPQIPDPYGYIMYQNEEGEEIPGLRILHDFPVTNLINLFKESVIPPDVMDRINQFPR